MRVLIDECIDERLRAHLSGHICETARYAGFAGLKNGELLKAAELARFDVLVTIDKNLPSQQKISSKNIAVIVLSAATSRLQDLLTAVPEALRIVATIQRGEWSGPRDGGDAGAGGR